MKMFPFLFGKLIATLNFQPCIFLGEVVKNMFTMYLKMSRKLLKKIKVFLNEKYLLSNASRRETNSFRNFTHPTVFSLRVYAAQMPFVIWYTNRLCYY